MQRYGELEARSIQAEADKQNLELKHREALDALNREELVRRAFELRCATAERRVSETEKTCLEVETKRAEVEQALDLARTVHARELEKVKKEREESENNLRTELKDMKGQRDRIREAIRMAARSVDTDAV